MDIKEDYSWTNDPDNQMSIVIKKNGVKLFSFFLGEAMESAGRTAIMKHVKECDNSPWITTWHDTAWEILKEKDGRNN